MGTPKNPVSSKSIVSDGEKVGWEKLIVAVPRVDLTLYDTPETIAERTRRSLRATQHALTALRRQGRIEAIKAGNQWYYRR